MPRQTYKHRERQSVCLEVGLGKTERAPGPQYGRLSP
jgi:hypothetical protein